VAGARAKLGIGRSVFSALGRPMGCDVAASDPDLRDFYGGFTDGVYGYLVPFGMGESRSGKVARLDLRDFASVTSLDLTTAVRRLTFVAGKEGGIRRGDTVTGAISGATATVAGVAVTSGAWATGDAAGDLYLRDQTGSFVAESLNAARAARSSCPVAPAARAPMRMLASMRAPVLALCIACRAARSIIMT